MKKIDLTSRLINTPLLMTQDHAESFACFAPDSFQIEDYSTEPSLFDGMASFLLGATEYKPYRMDGDVAVIPVAGSLIHKMNWSGWGMTGYGYIRGAFDTALQDPDVKGIVFDVNSGGGEVNGAFELAEHIFDNRSLKPSMAIMDSHSYSAAYLIGSAAGSMSVPRTGGAGSIGVVTMHTDYSKYMADAGVEITFIHAGKHKVDGNPYEGLSDDVKNRIQARIDDSYGLFVDAVAKHRGLSTQVVKDTEAQTFGANEALDLGLVDVVASPDAAMASFAAELNGTQKRKETIMATSQESQAAQTAAKDNEANMITKENLVEAETKGRTEERTRYSEVMSSEHYEGRETLANAMLAESDLSASQINQMLSKAQKVEVVPVADAAVGANAFADAMGGSNNPEVGSGADDSASENSDDVVVAGILASYTAHTGQKFN